MIFIDIGNIYFLLNREYGYQGWWPLIRLRQKGQSNVKLYNGYHPFDYSYPSAKEDIFEICVGSILVQNTSWENANQALTNLYLANLLSPESIISADDTDLIEAIKCSGYYNQKVKKLKFFSLFFKTLKGVPSKEDIMNIWGIGEETCDTILLYAYNKPYFIVDSYTRRFLDRLGVIDKSSSDNEIRGYVNKSKLNYMELNEIHALIVEHSKLFCKAVPECRNCPLNSDCNYYIQKYK